MPAPRGVWAHITIPSSAQVGATPLVKTPGAQREISDSTMSILAVRRMVVALTSLSWILLILPSFTSSPSPATVFSIGMLGSTLAGPKISIFFLPSRIAFAVSTAFCKASGEQSF